jgi:exopolysaccharide production protein ExoZ
VTEVVRRPAEDRLEYVQVLRAIAALLVVLLHAHLAVDEPGPRAWGDRYFGDGAIGVDLFFVISGLIMVHTTLRARTTPVGGARFLARRLARIWPVYAAHTFLYLLVLKGHRGLPGHPTAWAAVGRALLFYPQKATGAPFYGYAPLAPGWTLVYEAWFYVLFAISLATGRRRWAVFFGLGAATLFVLPLVLTGTWHADAYEAYPFRIAMLAVVTNPLVAEFAAGAMIGLVYHGRWRLRSPLARAALLLVSTGLLLTQYFTHFHSGHGPTRWGGPVVLFVLALTLQERERPMIVPRGLRWLLWLGEISFSLYLVQLLPQTALRSRFPEVAFFHSFAWFWLSIALAIALAWVSYELLERRVSERVRRWLLARLPRE